MLRVILPLVASLLAACGPATEAPDEQAVGTRVDQRMGSVPDPGFARAIEPRAFQFPADHGPHPEYATEWWYFTGNLRSDDGRRLGYQLTLFRVGLKPGMPEADSAWRARQIYMGHLAVSDIEAGRHLSAERFARAAAGLAGARTMPLRVWLGPWSIEGAGVDGFPLRLSAADTDIGIALTLERGERPVVLQGERGLSRKGAAEGNASYYYSLTRLPTRGEIRLGDRRLRVTGHSWFDREWSSSALAPDQAGWDWFALHLEDGRDLMFYRMRGKDGRAQRFSQGVLVEAPGVTHALTADEVKAQPTRVWRTGDGVAYPVAWRLVIPRHALDLEVEAAFDAQEMHHAVRYWEGAVTVAGSHRGVGYLELSGYAD
jgi:predicted secreted hydrolase